MGIVSLAVCSNVVAQAPAPLAALNPPAQLSDYYPRVAWINSLMARVEIDFQPSQYSNLVKPLSLSLRNVEVLNHPDASRVADPDRYEELFIAPAARLVDRLRFNERAKEQRVMRLSVLFLLSPCNQMTHGATADYYITVCREPLVPSVDGPRYE